VGLCQTWFPWESLHTWEGAFPTLYPAFAFCLPFSARLVLLALRGGGVDGRTPPNLSRNSSAATSQGELESGLKV
jgi:hypothetical protein